MLLTDRLANRYMTEQQSWSVTFAVQNKDRYPTNKPLYARSGSESGGRLNKKDGLTRYGDSHVKDKSS